MLRAVPSTVRMAALPRRGASPPFRNLPPGIVAPAKPALEDRAWRTGAPGALDVVDAHAARGAFDRAHGRLTSEGGFAPLPKPPPRNRCAGKAGARRSIVSHEFPRRPR